jgi:isocitrate dehydrogenase
MDNGSEKCVPITVAHGDGIGPEITAAVLRILKAAGARLYVEPVQIGKTVYEYGVTSGIGPEAWESIRATKVFLKGPVTTPQGGGFKSVNVTLRKTLGLYANIRPCQAYAPYVHTRHPEMDVVIIRENEEDLYAGIEHRQTDEVMQCLKLITRPGCEKIVRYAFEYARRYGRKRLTCITKDNIMKLTDGLFHKVFDEIGVEYPDIVQDHLIVDIGAARLADTPQDFDMIVTTNLYGDILSDIAAQVAGSVGLAGSANIGQAGAMFEAIHGSAPTIAGKDIANPSGMLQAAVMMLIHIGQADVATKVQNAWLKTIENGVHTADVYTEGVSSVQVGTKQFADAVIENLGELPSQLKPVSYVNNPNPRISRKEEEIAYTRAAPALKTLVGVDIFLHWNGNSADELGMKINEIHSESLKLEMITNRGVKVWPSGMPETFKTDHWRCRFKAKTPDGTIRHSDIVSLMAKMTGFGLDFIKSENLCNFDGVPGYAMGQGQ